MIKPSVKVIEDKILKPEILHILFICRGNACRSIIAEAYLKSLNIKNITIKSVGSVATIGKSRNKIRYQRISRLLKRHNLQQYIKTDFAEQLTQELLDQSDIAICVNRKVFNNIPQSFILPKETYYWDITDIGEVGRIPSTSKEVSTFEDQIFSEVIQEVDKFVAERIAR